MPDPRKYSRHLSQKETSRAESVPNQPEIRTGMTWAASCKPKLADSCRLDQAIADEALVAEQLLEKRCGDRATPA